jgi:hypothetical protein
MTKKLTLLVFVLCALSFNMMGQIRTPAPSPSAKFTQTVGLTDVMVEYSRPSKRGRTIFGNGGVVPFGEIWRTGANSVTKISFSTDVKVEGQDLKAGDYGILTMPGATSWAVHFYPYESSNWSSYVEKTPAVAVKVAPVTMAVTVESFAIMFDNLRNDGATLEFLWDNTAVPVQITADADASIMAAIDRTLAGPTAADYYAAGSYLHDSGKDLNKALMYVKKATSVSNAAFWQVRKEALILADLGKKEEAIAAAKRSLELAKAAGNNDYVRMNEASIKQWSM